MPKSILQKLPEKVKDISGQKFGRWTVIKFSHMVQYKHPNRLTRGCAIFVCKCECGKTKKVFATNLRSGKSTNCGCWHQESARHGSFKHGGTHMGKKTAEYSAWILMKQRCYNKNDSGFKYYGARGITVCERWRNSFLAFISDMGKKPSPELWLDRIDNDGNYTPKNCKWSTAKEQANNRRPPQFLHGDRRFNPKSGEPEHLKLRMAFKKKRNQLNLSQARAGKILGVSPTAIRKWEIGSYQPRNSWKKVLKLLGASKKKPPPT